MKMDRNDKQKSSEENMPDVSSFNESEKNSGLFTAFQSSANKLPFKLCRQPPRSYKTRKDEIPFFIPHKKLLEKIEYKPEIREPLTGFSAQQEKIRKQIHKPLISLTKVDEKKILTKDVTSDTGVESKERISWAFQKYKKETDFDAPRFIDQLELIRQLREDPKVGFFYMIYAVDRSSKYFTPYALKVVQYKDVGKTYMTISASGVTQYCPDEMSFTPIEHWEREYIFYLKLLKIRTFIMFRMWKALYVWKKSVSYKKFVMAKNYLKENLFVSDSILSKALLEIKSMCSIFLDSSFFDNSILEKMLLFYFVEKQFTKLELLRNKLDEFRRLAIDIVNNACLGALLKAGYTPDDSNITIEQTAYGKLGSILKGVNSALRNSKCRKMVFLK